MSTEQPTGQALNSLIAEHVMGWTEWQDLTEDCPNLPGVTYFAAWGDKGGVAVYEADDQAGDVTFYFNPVVEIADAWLVVERMRLLGFDYVCRSIVNGFNSFTFDDWRDCEPIISEQGASYTGQKQSYDALECSLPLAICKAALAVVEKVGALERAQGVAVE